MVLKEGKLKKGMGWLFYKLNWENDWSNVESYTKHVDKILWHSNKYTYTNWILKVNAVHIQVFMGMDYKYIAGKSVVL